MTEKRHQVWMVRAGAGGYLIEDFIENGIIAIGWNEIGEIAKSSSYEELKSKFKKTYPDDSDGRVNQCVSQIWKFIHEIKIGDKVVTYDSSTRQYYTGTIISDYQFSTQYEYHNYRKIEWDDAPINRDDLPIEIKNILGSTLTIFLLNQNTFEEIEKKSPAYISEEELKDLEEIQEKYEKEDLDRLKEDVILKSQEFIKDGISKLSWQDTELLVAGLLKALGYNTRFTPKGSDLGSDIIASPDVLGLEEPQIKVEVKKRTNEKMGAPEIRSFIGGLRGYHKGIYVTTGGFTKEARYEAERANFPITLIDSDWLVELLISNYEKLEPEIKALVPLRKIYWPI